ncbi:hypothetical protein MPTK1_6g19130 [Marchantia polymorpha subsp. ruderalis]|uniref:RING-type domain-containing protein n=2 Tax=Marchantia polymorpha TaxID=3197 RepID=A0AAF6BTP5_MARPO|nr:hypothetical protein MARPO_0045s0150 [Marchantia polymorpha]BBN15379.1 hypothetical protein Mp_6g19130 [Marchantia polymorpha subsp. ruderalis]|eukprot:PTQ39509.1 hypothetical protein MARPO_0045s0150 [Marchantia polymorpha]
MHVMHHYLLKLKRIDYEAEPPRCQLIMSKMEEFVMKFYKLAVSVFWRMHEVLEEATKFLPCLLMICWSARSHMGPPEYEIDDANVDENPLLVEKIKGYLKEIQLTRSNRKEADDCTVCLSEFMDNESVYKLPGCNHLFHKVCLTQWLLLNKTTCPLCRCNLDRVDEIHLSEIPFQERQMGITVDQD